MRRTLAEAIQTGVQARVQAALAANVANAAPAAPRQQQNRNNNPLFDEQEDDIEEEDNPFGDGPRQLHQRNDRPNRNYDNQRWTSGIKIEIPEYNGGSSPEDLLDWFVTVDEFMEFKDVPELKRVPLVTTRFRGHASTAGSKPGSDTN